MANPRRQKAQDNRGGRGYDSGPSGLSNPRQSTVYQGNETCEHPTTAIEPRQRTSGSSTAAIVYPTLCQQCAELHQLVRQIAHELSKLLAEIRGAMTGEHLKQYTNLEIESQKDRLDPAKGDLHQLVGWIIESIESTTRILSLVRLNSSQRSTQAFQLRNKSEIGHSPAGTKRKSKFHDADDGGAAALSSLHHQREPRSREGSLALYLSDEDRASKASDESPPLTSHSTRSSSGSVFGKPQPLLQASSESRSLLLPSPKLPSTLMLPPISPSLTGSASHLAHLQELQQQIDTRTLAFETLQREHQSLLSAFSRSQSRVATLDKKFIASEAEINELNDGRVRLQAQIEALEAQVQEIQQIREIAHTQSITEGAQYMQIVAMSSKLQAQGASDSQKWKAEREQWELDKKAFMMQIEHLEREKQALLRSLRASEPSDSSLTHDKSTTAIGTLEGTDTQASRCMLREEIRELRIKCNNLEAALQAIRHESSNFGQAFARLGSIGRRLQQHLQMPPNEASLQENTDDTNVQRRGSDMSED